LDVASFCGKLVEGAAQRRYLNSKIAFLNDRVRPDSANDLVLRDEFARSLDQNPKYFLGARADLQRDQATALFSPEQAAPVETEMLEQKDVGRAERPSATVI
jgi:hypothetical protein